MRHLHALGCPEAQLDAIFSTTSYVHFAGIEFDALTSVLFQNHDDNDDPAPPLEQLVDEGLLAVLAGSDTTASSLATIFACLLSSKSVYDALEAEIDQFYPRGADVFDISKHRDMKYLSAVMCVLGFRRSMGRTGELMPT